MKAAFHKYVKIVRDCLEGAAYGKRTYYLHVVERADGVNLYFATDGMGWPLNAWQTLELVEEYKAGNFENAEKDLDRCPARL